MLNRTIAAGLCLIALAAASPARAQIAGMNGTWTLDPEASQGPIAACEYLHYEISADEQHYIVDEREQDGSKFNTEYRAKFDGAEYPNKNLVTGKVNYVRIRKVFDRVEQLTNVKRETGADGKEVSTVSGHYIRVLSPDGKTITSTLIDPDGKVTSVRVFRKLESATKPTC